MAWTFIAARYGDVGRFVEWPGRLDDWQKARKAAVADGTWRCWTPTYLVGRHGVLWLDQERWGGEEWQATTFINWVEVRTKLWKTVKLLWWLVCYAEGYGGYAIVQHPSNPPRFTDDYLDEAWPTGLRVGRWVMWWRWRPHADAWGVWVGRHGAGCGPFEMWVTRSKYGDSQAV